MPAAWADDSTAELGVGGLHFTHTSAIQMTSEDLFLSTEEVRIHYVFHNRTNRDVTTRVAFPLPDITPNYYFEPVGFPNTGDPNFVNFETRADGRRVPMEAEQHARLRGTDITARGRAARLPLSPIDPHFDDAIKRLSAPERQQLVRAHLIEDVGGDPANPEFRALWTLTTIFSRMQTFPAGRDVVVEQRYRPIVGGSVGSTLLIESTDRATVAERRRMIRTYCVDDAFQRAAHEALRRSGQPYVPEQRLSYVLTTGANWAGPIGRFHLTIDKGAPGNLMSVCAPDIHRTSPTRFELERSNYTPRSNIQILILTPEHAGQ